MRSIILIALLSAAAGPAFAGELYKAPSGDTFSLNFDHAPIAVMSRAADGTQGCEWVAEGDGDITVTCGGHREVVHMGDRSFRYDGERFTAVNPKDY